jgi:tetratricopeptide (TPR) repeat protein
MVHSALYYWGLPTRALAERARLAADKAVALAPKRAEGYQALGDYARMVQGDFTLALQHYAKGQTLGTPNADILVGIAIAESGLGRWDDAVERLKQAGRLDPRSVAPLRRLGDTLVKMRRFREAREVLDRALALAPSNLACIEGKAMSFLGEGDLAGARDVIRAASSAVSPTELVAYVATYEDLVWVLDEKQRELLLRLTPSAFDDDSASWALCLTQAYALKGDAANVRRYAEEARATYEQQLRDTPDNSQQHALLGLTLAYLGRKEDAIREGLKGVELAPRSKDADSSLYNTTQLARIYALVGEQDKAIDLLEANLQVPAYVSPGWISVNPYWEPLHSSPRYPKLVAKGK